MLVRVAAAAVVLACSAPASAAARTCASGGKTVLRNADVRVWRIGDAGEMRYRACWLSRPSRLLRLGTPTPGPAPTGVSRLRLAGGFVAFEDWWCDRDAGCAAGVEVVDVRRGRTMTADNHVDGRVRGLVLAPSGLAAWTVRADVDVTVRAWNGRGLLTLAEGPRIEPGSVALAGRRVYWLDDGEPRSDVI